MTDSGVDILLAYQRAAQRAQDLKWRAAVEELRATYESAPVSDYSAGWEDALGAIVRAMGAE